MGYLSQKKSKAREQIFFTAASVVMLLVAVGLLINPEMSVCGFNLFHFYCIGWLLVISSIIARRTYAVLILSFSLLVCYVLLAMSGNIFFSDRINGDYHLKLDYNSYQEDKNVISRGVLLVGQTEIASYAVVNEEAPIMMIRVDLSNTDRVKYPVILKSLRKFIMKQDIEVVVWGNFGMPAWSKVFRNFVDVSGLSVKNRLIFDDLFKAPNFYVLGYNNIGVESIKYSNGNVKAQISYDIL